MPYILALYVKTYRLVTQKSYKKEWIGLKKGDYMTDKQESLLKLAELFKILGDPTRLKIVELLLENEMCVNHIAETMETVSYTHLDVYERQMWQLSIKFSSLHAVLHTMQGL